VLMIWRVYWGPERGEVDGVANLNPYLLEYLKWYELREGLNS
jgi:hypothetical protein